MSKVGIKKKLLRKEVDFELNPPRCINCNYFQAPDHGVPSKKFYSGPSCRLHQFSVKLHSICNVWVGRAGEVLEAA